MGSVILMIRLIRKCTISCCLLQVKNTANDHCSMLASPLVFSLSPERVWENCSSCLIPGVEKRHAQSTSSGFQNAGHNRFYWYINRQYFSILKNFLFNFSLKKMKSSFTNIWYPVDTSILPQLWAQGHL